MLPDEDYYYTANGDDRMMITRAIELVMRKHNTGWRYRLQHNAIRGHYATIYDIAAHTAVEVCGTLQSKGYVVRHRIQPNGEAYSIQIMRGVAPSRTTAHTL